LQAVSQKCEHVCDDKMRGHGKTPMCLMFDDLDGVNIYMMYVSKIRTCLEDQQGS